ncbi:MAG: hypothetical protein A2Y72_06255 [Chloroflexi bacterium RBG_13_53_26]|nr:MAG: hypothetical protein A2Y72_06255 [Chloroflexi bacterium RBG_13_53_26]
MQQVSTASVLTSGEACSLVYHYLYHRLDGGRRHRLAKYRSQFTATSLGSHRWHVFTWLASFGQWNVNGATPAMEPVDAIARRLNWEFEQSSEEPCHPDT